MTTERRELVERIWSRDPTIWTGKDEARWLGWLDEPSRMRQDVELLLTLANDVSGEFDDFVLLGMGGSSLASGGAGAGVSAGVRDPRAPTRPIRRRSAGWSASSASSARSSSRRPSPGRRSRPARHCRTTSGRRRSRSAQWVAITDPGSDLEQPLARARVPKRAFPGEPTIGGRYSALSAAFRDGAGGAARRRRGPSLLDRALEMADACRLDEGNPGLEPGNRKGTAWEERREQDLHPERR